MQIGLDMYKPEHAELFADLGVTWTKRPVSMHTPTDEPDAIVADAVAHGLQVVIDLRTDQGHYRPIVDEYRRHGVGDAYRRMVDDLAHLAAQTVRRHKGIVHTYEFWGEYACPFVSGVIPGDKSDGYGIMLKTVADAIRAEDPEAAVWTGGHGPNFDLRFLRGLIEDEAATAPDAVNLHHYNYLYPWPPEHGATLTPGAYRPDRSVSLADRVSWTALQFSAYLAEAKARLARVGVEPRLVSTEWGLPIVMDGAAEGSGLESFVFDARIEAVEDTPAAAIVDACLSTFKRAGMQVLIYHCAQDGGPRDDGRLHWGDFTGLTYADGERKAVYDVLKRWAQKGQTLEQVQRAETEATPRRSKRGGAAGAADRAEQQ